MYVFLLIFYPVFRSPHIIKGHVFWWAKFESYPVQLSHAILFWHVSNPSPPPFCAYNDQPLTPHNRNISTSLVYIFESPQTHFMHIVLHGVTSTLF